MEGDQLKGLEGGRSCAQSPGVRCVVLQDEHQRRTTVRVAMADGSIISAMCMWGQKITLSSMMWKGFLLGHVLFCTTCPVWRYVGFFIPTHKVWSSHRLRTLAFVFMFCVYLGDVQVLPSFCKTSFASPLGTSWMFSHTWLARCRCIPWCPWSFDVL